MGLMPVGCGDLFSEFHFEPLLPVIHFLKYTYPTPETHDPQTNIKTAAFALIICLVCRIHPIIPIGLRIQSGKDKRVNRTPSEELALKAIPNSTNTNIKPRMHDAIITRATENSAQPVLF